MFIIQYKRSLFSLIHESCVPLYLVFLHFAFILYHCLLSRGQLKWIQHLSVKIKGTKYMHKIKASSLFPIRYHFCLFSQQWINTGFVQSYAFTKVAFSYWSSLKTINSKPLLAINMSLHDLFSFLLSSASDTFSTTEKTV